MALKILNGERGAQIIEVFIATIILLTTALAIFNLFIMNRNVSERVSAAGNCQGFVESTFQTITAMGLRIDAHDPPDTAPYRYTPGTNPGVETGILAADRWPDEPEFDIMRTNNGNELRHKTPWLIRGSINGLLSIYNSDQLSCTALVGIAYPSLMPIGLAQETLPGISPTIRIQPYNLDDRSLAGCPRFDDGEEKLMIAPRSGIPQGNAFTETTFGPCEVGEQITRNWMNCPNPDVTDKDVRDDLGLLVTVTVDYTGPTGDPMTCSGTSRYEYPIDEDAPSAIRLPYAAKLGNMNPAAGISNDYITYWEYLLPDAVRGSFTAFDHVYRFFGRDGPTDRNYHTTQKNPSAIDNTFGVDKTYDFGDDFIQPNLTVCRPTSGGGAGPQLAPFEQDVLLDFGYLVTDLEPGSIVMCRDVSTTYRKGTGGAVRGGAHCIEPDGQYGKFYDRKTCGTLGLIVDGSPVNCGLANAPLEGDFSDPAQGWTPCDLVSACRIAPDAGPPSQPPQRVGNRVRFQNNYSDIPKHCEIRIEMAAIDTAGNIEVTLITHQNESECGPFCGTAPGYPEGYFYCGGCPDQALAPPPRQNNGTWNSVPIIIEPCGPGLPNASCDTNCATNPPVGGGCLKGSLCRVAVGATEQKFICQ